jgi:hypothetical protein
MGGLDPGLGAVLPEPGAVVEAHRQALEARPAVPEGDAEENRAGEVARTRRDRHQLFLLGAVINFAHHRGARGHKPRPRLVDRVEFVAK